MHGRGKEVGEEGANSGLALEQKFRNEKLAMVYKSTYFKAKVHVIMIVLVVKFTRVEESERHLVQFPKACRSTSLGIQGGRLASWRIFGEIWPLKQPVL